MPWPRAPMLAAALFAVFQLVLADDKAGVVSWETLAQVSVTRQKDRYIPEFSRQIAALDRREIRLKGFMLPIPTGALGRCDACFRARPPALALRVGRHRVEYPREVVDTMPAALRKAFEASPARIR